MPSYLLYLKQSYFCHSSLYISRVISVVCSWDISAILFPLTFVPLQDPEENKKERDIGKGCGGLIIPF
jgi:hypothetical protein